ncbi:13998_t:CDS:2 [Funneliformis geosporum]|uniref:13998_t:CDS:1 n=1 Tax=Funneliformis geosporum TaxID=1117311 RepID=A0A9W4WRY6_9GLOM|nr:13998_t:CDS:2 [Funneliformis geosporum]
MTIKFKDYREFLLRSIFIVVFSSIIIGLSIEKISIAFKIKDVDPLISMQIKDLSVMGGFPVWSSFICTQNMTSLRAQTLKRGKPNGTSTTDVATDLPSEYISPTNTNSLAAGDWTLQLGAWPCFIFNPRNIQFIPGVVDQIILMAFINEGEQVLDGQNNLLFGIFDEERNMSMVEPFVGPTPSVNTFTFTRTQKIDVNKTPHSYFFVNKQNSNKIDGGFGVKNMVARFLYAPDTYMAVTYTERRPYTPFDLISAVGGLMTYTLAIWFLMFGRGKYRSWGLVQRYLLHNSPDALKKDEKNRLLPITYKDQKDLESQINCGLSPTTGSSSPPLSVNAYTPSLYFFSTNGTPTQQNFPSSPSNPMASSKSLNKRIDARINLKLWFVEQTLNRHYLSGFRLRNYDVDFKKFGIETYDDEEIPLTPPTAHHNWSNFNSGAGVYSPDHNSHGKFQTSSSPSPSPHGSQIFQKKNNNNSPLNPEELRPQYPNVTLNQVPIEKKNRGRNSTSASSLQPINHLHRPGNR